MAVSLRRTKIGAGHYVFSAGIGRPDMFRATRSHNGSWLLAQRDPDGSGWLVVTGYPTLGALTAGVEGYRA